jgi:hypothetical protein
MRLVLLLLLSALPLFGRAWRNTEGTQSFEAEFLASDGIRVTLKRQDGRIVTFSMSKLHRDDQAWVRDNVAPKDLAKDAPPPKGAAFDTLEFGDDRTKVEAKLKASPFVDTAVNETLFGRTGLNGVFKTKETIGGLHCYLFFDWSKAGALREVTLQTQPVPGLKYTTTLRGNWYELIDLLSKLHGRPEQAAEFPESKDLQDGLILGSHLWYTEEGHSVILGTGQEGAGYNVVVRITSERIRPVPVGAGNGGDATADPTGLKPSAADFRP